jgi:prepilin-type N-terminal cleavage/methylation domain-containing protein
MRLRDQRGVSLIELLVAVAVFAVLVLIIDAVFISAHRGARKAELGADVNQNARIAVERLTAEIRESSAVLISTGAGDTAVVFRSARPSDSGNGFCLDWASGTEPLAVANNTPPCTGVPLTGTYAPVWQRWIGYYFDAGELRRVTSTDALDAGALSGGQVIATSVETFTVMKGAGSPATVTVALKGKGMELVQGSSVPPQEIVLNVTTVIRN